MQLGLVGQQVDRTQLNYRPFATDELLLVIGRDDQWRRRRKVRIADVLRRSVILREPGSGSRRCLEQTLMRAGHSLDDFNVAMELGSNESIKEAVVNGNGIAILSRFAVQRDLDQGRLHSLLIEGMTMTRTLFVVSDSRRAVPRPARAFLQFLFCLLYTSPSPRDR